MATIAKAKKKPDDEYYTLYDDIQKELNYYKEHFNNKIVLCNCDDPFESNFFKFFIMNFNYLNLKCLICTCYKGSPMAFTIFDYLKDDNEEILKSTNGYVLDINEVPMENGRGVTGEDIEKLLFSKKYGVKKLRGDGDFKSEECLKYLDIADIVVTNPPFSKFKEYLPLLINYNKKFLVIGDKNQITYEDIFPLFKSNKIWLGYTRPNKFLLPNGIITDKMNGRPRWFTNLNIKKRDEELILYKEYNVSEYPKLENFDAIFVDEIVKIPNDYYETMAVPITFLDKYNPKQFEILGCSSCISLFGIERKEPSLEFLQKYKTGKVRTKGNYQNSKPMWIDSEGYANIGYHRIFIRRK